VACHNRESCYATQTVQRAKNAPILLIQCIPPEVESAGILGDPGIFAASRHDRAPAEGKT
jgi:hypothetical protein